MAEEVPRVTKHQVFKRQSSYLKDQGSTEQNKRGRSSASMPPPSNVWVCNNPACRARQSTSLSFCKRCSCCICRQYDDNKDPSLWLECVPDSGPEGSCGFSCHVECALAIHPSSCTWMDGSYCCASCGKVSSIIRFWKKQLKIAMEAHRIDVLCYRIFLSYKLLNGTSRYEELHRPIKDLKAKLEIELGPLNEAAAKMSRGHASRLHAAGHVQSLCKLALQKAEEHLTSISSSLLLLNDSSVPSSETQHTVIVVLDEKKELQESSWSGAHTVKRDAVSDVQLQTLPHGRLALPDLNEEFGDDDGLGCRSDDDLEGIVQIIRGLEQDGHMSKEFRLKFFTWYSLRSKDHERKVVRAFVKAMIDDPTGLAGQLIDTFSDIIFTTRP